MFQLQRQRSGDPERVFHVAMIFSLLVGLALSFAFQSPVASQEEKKKNASDQKQATDRKKQDDERPAIKVGDKTMSKQEFQEKVDRRLKRSQRMSRGKKGPGKASEKRKKMIRNRLKKRTIDRLLIEHHAEKSDVSVSEEEIQSEWNDLVQKHGGGSEEKLKEKLKKAGEDPEEFKNRIIEDQVRVKKFLDKNIPEKEVTDEEAKSYFENNKKRMKGKKFEDVKGKIKEQLKQKKKREESRKLIKNLKEKTEIEVNL